MNSKNAMHEEKEENLKEIFDVEKMHTDALESLMKSLNNDHATSQIESTATMKQIKDNVAVKNKIAKEANDKCNLQNEKCH